MILSLIHLRLLPTAAAYPFGNGGYGFDDGDGYGNGGYGFDDGDGDGDGYGNGGDGYGGDGDGYGETP